MILSSLPEGKELTLNGNVVPGIVRSVNINGKMQADRNAKADGGGGRDFTLKGWEPAEVSVELALLGDSGPQVADTSRVSLDALLTSLVGLFKKTDEGGEAVQYELSFPQTQAWGIGRCYFTDMSSSQSSKQMYNVSLKFVEFRPEIDQVKRQQEEKKKELENDTPAGPAPEPAPLPLHVAQQIERLKEQNREN